MQADAYQEFLHANSRRSYPFVEDSSLWDNGQTYQIPTELLVNFRGFTRQQPESPDRPVQLSGIVGPSALPLPGPFDTDPSGWVLVFRIGSLNQMTGTPQYLRVLVNSNSTHSAHTVAFVPSAFGQDQPPGDMANHGLTRNPAAANYDGDSYDYLAAMIQVSTAQEQSLDLLPADDAARLYFSEAHIEPALMTKLWKTEIERLVIEDQCWSEADVRGPVVFREGYNTEIIRLGNSILLSPQRRAGRGVQSVTEYEDWLCTDGSSSSGGPSGSSEFPSGSSSDSLTPDEQRILELREPCRGNILHVNGVAPDENYSFRILGGTGVTVKNLANEHKIIININIPQPVTICPDEPEVL